MMRVFKALNRQENLFSSFCLRCNSPILKVVRASFTYQEALIPDTIALYLFLGCSKNIVVRLGKPAVRIGEVERTFLTIYEE